MTDQDATSHDAARAAWDHDPMALAAVYDFVSLCAATPREDGSHLEAARLLSLRAGQATPEDNA